VARRLNKMGLDASALEGGFDAWKEKYSVEPVETEQTVG
jgi:rhodanese-related sulfurtransferase